MCILKRAGYRIRKLTFNINIDNMKYVNVECSRCAKVVIKKQHVVDWHRIHNSNYKFYCSRQCVNGKPRCEVKCKNCNKKIIKYNYEISTSKNIFCGKSCAAKYNNTHKVFGTRRSKLEIWLEEQLVSKYPDLDIHFNRKDTINSELDIYVPSMKLAFELNGIYHYEPIHGNELLEKIQNNDNRKFQACLERGIELCIINSSKLVYFKELEAKKFLDIITNIISFKTASPGN